MVKMEASCTDLRFEVFGFFGDMQSEVTEKA